MPFFLFHLRSDRLEYNFKSLDFDLHQVVIKAIQTSDTWARYVFLFHFNVMKKWWKKGTGRSIMLKRQYTNFSKEIDLNYGDDEWPNFFGDCLGGGPMTTWVLHRYCVAVCLWCGCRLYYAGVFQELFSRLNQKQKYCRVLVDKLTKVRNKAR